MTAIATLTMNPALDLATATEAVVPGDKLRCDAPRYDPGGGGINVARAVCVLGGNAVAVFPAGGPAGLGLRRLLKRERVPHRAIPIAGQTRESFTVDERRNGQQYRFVLPGPALEELEQARCVERLVSLTPPPRYVVASGSLPPGVPAAFFGHLAERLRTLGAPLILDASGAALHAARGSGIYLVKPNLRELGDLLGRQIRGDAEEVAAARELIGMGLSEVVVLSLGARGALLVSARGHERFPPIEVPVLRSAVGAGDSMVAALTLALVRGLELREAVGFGMAAGAAALMTPGTELCRRDDVERLFAQTGIGQGGIPTGKGPSQ